MDGMSTFSAHEQNSIFLLVMNICICIVYPKTYALQSGNFSKAVFGAAARAFKISTRVRDTAPRAALSRAQDAPAALGLESEPARPHRDRLLARDRGPFRRGERASTGCLIRESARFP